MNRARIEGREIEVRIDRVWTGDISHLQSSCLHIRSKHFNDTWTTFVHLSSRILLAFMYGSWLVCQSRRRPPPPLDVGSDTDLITIPCQLGIFLVWSSEMNYFHVPSFVINQHLIQGFFRSRLHSYGLLKAAFCFLEKCFGLTGMQLFSFFLSKFQEWNFL